MALSSFAQKAITVTDFVGSVAAEAARVGSTAQEVSTFLLGVKLVASFIPGLSAVAGVLDVAEPIIQKIAIAAPILHRAIERGDAVVQLANQNGLFDSAKQLLAIAINSDPARTETNLTAADITNEQAQAFMPGIFERSFFTPQDPRFARMTENMG